MSENASKRDSGIDLLRVFAMGLIVLHHLLLHGGLTSVFPVFSPSGMAVHLLNAFTRSAVNVYALISGYVMVRSRFRPSRLIGLWLQVVFYGVLAVVCLSLAGRSIHPAALFAAFTPVSHDAYWYFTCYFVVFCLSPFLNLLLNSLSRRQTGLMLTVLTTVFSLLPTLMLTDRFQLNGGYHPVWLILLYLFGGAARLHGFQRSGFWKAVLTAAGCILLSWGFRLGALAAGAGWLEELLLHYTSPTMLLCSLALFSLFAGRKLPARLAKAVSFLSPLTFGVYLIHDNHLVREQLIKMRLTGLAELNPAMMLCGLFVCWAGVYVLCLLIEWLRTRLFTLLRIPALCNAMEKKLFSLEQCMFPEC